MLKKSVFIFSILLVFSAVFALPEEIYEEEGYVQWAGSEYCKSKTITLDINTDKSAEVNVKCKTGNQEGVFYYDNSDEKDCANKAKTLAVDLSKKGYDVLVDYTFHAYGCCAVKLVDEKNICDADAVDSLNIAEGTTSIVEDKILCSYSDNGIIIKGSLSTTEFGGECSNKIFKKPVCTNKGAGWEINKCEINQGCDTKSGCEDFICEKKGKDLFIKGKKSGRVYKELYRKLDGKHSYEFSCTKNLPEVIVKKCKELNKEELVIEKRIKELCNKGAKSKASETLKEEEFIEYLKLIEKLNPDKNWKQIISQLHEKAYKGDSKINIFFVDLFIDGEENKGFEDVLNICTPPPFMKDNCGNLVKISHTYAGLRAGLNRKGASKAFMVYVNTELGDIFQLAFSPTNWLNPLGTSSPAAKNQLIGDQMGMELSGRYEKHLDKKLSEAYKEYFDSLKCEKPSTKPSISAGKIYPVH